MSVKQVKIILLLLTVVIVSTAIIFLDTITAQTKSASATDKPGVLLPLETADKTPIDKPEQQQIFQVIPSISQSIRVPAVIRSIPQKIPRNISQIVGNLLNIESPIYRVVTSPTSSKNEMIMGYAEDCYGGTACRLGMISAEKLTETATEPPGSQVSLEDGIIGNFVEGSCGANCSDSTISWDYRGSRYTLGIKVGKQKTMVKMADVKLRKLVKQLQELLRRQKQVSLIEKMGISDQLIDRSERDFLLKASKQNLPNLSPTALSTGQKS